MRKTRESPQTRGEGGRVRRPLGRLCAVLLFCLLSGGARAAGPKSLGDIRITDDLISGSAGGVGLKDAGQTVEVSGSLGQLGALYTESLSAGTTAEAGYFSAAVSSPASAAVSGVYPASMTLVWGDGVPANPVGALYRVEISTAADFSAVAFSTNAAGFAWNFAGLSVNTTYHARVKAEYLEGDESQYRLFQATATLAAPPGELPVGLSTFTSVFSSSFTVNWASGTPASGYNPLGTDYLVQASTALDFSGTLASSRTRNLSGLVAGLLDNTTYYARVRAVNWNGVPGAFTLFGSTSTAAATPTDIKFDDISTHSIVASAYAASPAFTGLDRGQSGTNIFGSSLGGYAGWHGEKWTGKAPMPATVRSGVAAAGLGGRIYAIGGFNGVAFLATNEEYDPVTNAWTGRAAMPTSRERAGVVMAAGRIYAIGGAPSAVSVTAANEEYDPESNSWVVKSPMPTPRQHSAAAVARGKVYLFGGCGGGCPGGTGSTTNEEYDPETNSWSVKSAMLTARTFVGAAAVNDRIYVVGGYNGSALAANEEYDPASNSWAAKAAMPTARNDLGVAALGGKVYAVGGDGGLATVEEFDPGANSWIARSPMPTGRRVLAAASLGGRLYALGGDNGTKLNINEEYDPGSSQRFAGLTPNKQYSFKAKARNQVGTETGESITVSTYTLAFATMPQAGTQLFSGVFAASVTVNWSSGTNAGGFNGPGATYLVQASTMAGFIPVIGTSLTANIFATVAGLQVNTTHYFRVRPYNALGGTDFGWFVLGSTVSMAEEPAALAQTFPAVSTSAATVAWSAGGNPAGATRYSAALSTGASYPNAFAGNASLSTVPAGSPPTASLAGLAPNTTYFLFAAAVNHAGVATPYAALGATATLAAPPGELPVGLSTFTSVFSSSFTVNWASGTPASGYNPLGTDYLVQASTALDFSGTLASSQTRNLSGLVAGLLDNTTYYARVRAVNWNGVPGAFTLFGSTSTAAATPTDIKFDDISTHSIVASAYAASPAFSSMTVGLSGTNVARDGIYAGWHGEKWTTKAAMPTARDVLAVAAVGGKVYAVGGWNGVSWFTQTEEYDPASNTWAIKAAMSTAREGLAAAMVGGKIYAVGGNNGVSYQTANEEYDPVSNAWTAKAAMPTARRYLAAAMVGGKVYAVGGRNGVSYQTANEEYDPASNAWAIKAAMPTAREGLAAAAVGGKVYALGGVNGVSNYTANEEYDPASNTWSVKSAMPTARRYLAAAMVGGKIYAVGGNNGVSYQTANEEYDPVSNAWTAKAAVPTARFGLAAAAVGGKVYALGGWNGVSYQTANEEYDPGSSQRFAGLTPNKQYSFKAKARNQLGTETGESITVSTYTLATATMPQAGTQLFSGVFAASVTVNWSSGTDAGGYNGPGATYLVQASTMAGFIPVLGSSLTANIFATLTGLEANNTHYLRVLPYNALSGTDFAWFTLGSTVTPVNPPGSALSTFTAVHSSSMTVAWDANGNGGGTLYEAVLSTQTPFVATHQGNVVVSTRPEGAPSAVFNGLSANATYFLFARAFNRTALPTAYAALGSTITRIETPADIRFDDISTHSIVASAYAASPAFSKLGQGLSGVNAAIGPGYVYGAWRSGDKWTAKAAIPTARYFLAAAAVGGKVYAVGGWNGVSSLAATEEYDPVSNAWAIKSAMPTAREGPAAPAVGGKVYAVGGWNGVSYQTANEEYDPASNAWAIKSAMPTARRYLAAAAVGGKIYAVGGNNGVSYQTANEEYDPASNTWSAKSAMPTAREGLAAGVVGGKVYAVGGHNGVSYQTANEEYDPASNTWAIKSAMPTARFGLAAAAVGGKVYALGGNNGVSYQTATEEYDPVSNAWTAKSGMPTARQGLAAAAVGGKVYAVGGWNGVSYQTANEEYDPGSSQQFAGLTPNKQYSFKAKARNQFGTETGESITVSTYTLATATMPQAGTQLFSGVFAASITVNWSSGTDAGGYNGPGAAYLVQASTMAGFIPVLGSSLTANIFATVAGLQVNTTHYFRVRAYNTAGVTDSSWFVLGSTVSAVETPTDIKFDDISTHSIVASAYAASPAFTGLERGVSGVNVAAGPAYIYGAWRSGDKWTSKAAMPTARYFFAAAAAGGKVYAVGGWNGVSYLTANEEYDPASNAWSVKSAMPAARYGLAAAAVGGKVYAVGGWNGVSYLTVNEEYDPASDAWSVKSAMPTARRYLAAAAVGGKVYAVGGNNGVSYQTANEEYDPASNAWSVKSAMPTARDELAAGVVGGKVYAVGGWNGYQTANEEYDPASNAWTAKAAMPTAREGLAAAAVGGKIYAMGGNNGSYLAANEEYDPVSNAWTAKAPMSTARRALAAVAVGGKLYAVGGTNGSAFGTNEEYDPGSSQKFAGLTPNKQYFFKAKGRNSAGSETGESVAVSTYTLAVATAPQAGTQLFSTVWAASITVNWSSGTNAGGFNGPGAAYLVQASTMAGFIPVIGSSLTANPFATVAGLQVDNTHYFRVQAYNTPGVKDYSWFVLGSTVSMAEEPAAAAQTFPSVSTSAATVAWSAGGNPAGATRYSAVLSTGASYPNAFAGNASLSTVPAGGGPPTASLAGLAPNTTYFLFAAAVNHAGVATPYAALGATSTAAEFPGSAASTFTAVHAASMSVRWSANGNPVGVTTYTVTLSTGQAYPNAFAGNAVLSTAPSGGFPGATLAGLLSNATYFLYVEALNHNGLGSGVSALGSTATLVSDPAAAASPFTGVTNNALNGRWEANGNFPGTLYEAALSTGASYPNAYAGNVTVSTRPEGALQAAFGALASNTTYHLFVRAVGRSGLATGYMPLGATATLTNTPVAAAQSFAGVHVTSMSAAWDANGNAVDKTTYSVALSTGSGFPQGFAGDVVLSTLPAGASLSATLSGLSANTTYQLFAAAYNLAGALTPYAALGSSVTSAAEPAGPASFGGMGVSSFTAAWGANGNALALTTYTVQASTAADFNPAAAGSVFSTAPAAGPASSFVGLSPNTTYYLRARAVNHGGRATGFIVLGSTATLAAEPGAGSPTYAGVFLTSMSVAWSSGGNPLGISLYSVALSTSADFNAYASSVALATAPAAGPAATLGGLLVNTTYFLRVKAFNHNGVSGGAALLGSAATLASPPESAASTFSAVAASSMSVAWMNGLNPAQATRYRVALSTYPAYPNASIETAMISTTPAGAKPSATVSGLKPNTSYYLFVETLNHAGLSGGFAALGSTLTAADLPAPPSAGASTFTLVGISSIAARWGTGGNPAGTEYRAEVSTSASFGAGAAVGVSGWITSTTTVFVGLSTNSVRYFRVKARNSALTESAYAPLGATATLAETPSAAASVFLLVGVSSIQAQWQTGGNPLYTEYELQAATDSAFAAAASSGSWIAASSATIAGLSGDATYYLRVRARNSAGVSTEFLAIGSTATAAAAPQGGGILEAGPSSIRAAWDAGVNRGGESEGWAAQTSLPAAREAHAAAFSGGRLYFSGGVDTARSSDAWKAPVGPTGAGGPWSAVTPLPAPRESHAMAAWGGRLYVAGGFDGSVKATVWFAQTNADGSLGAWTETTPLPAGRFKHSLAAWKGRLYAAGGDNGVFLQSSVYYADIRADGSVGPWSLGPALPAARSGHAMAVSSGVLYVAGGVGSGIESTVWSSVLGSDGAPGAWAVETPMPEGRTRHSLAAGGGRLWSIAGHDGNTASGAVYSAELKAGGSLGPWEKRGSLIGGRYQHGGATDGERFYVLGGNDGAAGQASVFSSALLGTVYVAQRARDAGFTTDVGTRAVRGHEMEFAGLIPNTTYYVRVKSVGMDGRLSAYLLLGSTLTPAALPGSAVSTFTASSTGSLVGAWSLGDNPAGTEFQASLSTSADGGGTLILSSWSSFLSFGFAGLAPNTSYYLRAQARNSAALAGSYALLGSTYTLAAAPGGSAFKSVQTTGFTLEWSAGGNPALTRYEAQVATTASFGNVTASSVTLSTSSSFSGLLSAATFYARVRAYNGNGTASAFDGTVSTFTGLDTLAPSSATQASAHPSGSANAVEVFWTTPGDDGTSGDLVAGSRYYIQWTTSAPWGAEVGWSTSNAQVTASTGPVSAGLGVSVVVGGLPSLKTTYLKVWTKDESNNYSAPSDTISVFVSPFVLSTLDGSGIDAGSYASLAPDRSGDLHAAYTGGFGTQELRYLKRVSSAWGAVESPDPGVGAAHAVLAVDGDGRPKILYRGPSGELKLAGKSGSWSSETIESGDFIPGGVALDPAGVQVSYYDAAAKDLKHARWNGVSWSTSTVDSTGDVGRFSSLAIDSSGTPHIAYYDTTNADLKYARWIGASWSIETVDGIGVDVGSAPALALDGSGWARIAYADTTNQDVKFASKSSSGWTLRTVDGPGSMGNVGGLALDGSGSAAISYRDQGLQDLKAALWTGNSWSTMTVDSRGSQGAWSSPVIEPNGSITVVYKDSSYADLKAASWAAGLPAPIGGRGPLSGPTAFAGTAVSSGAIQWSWTDNAANERGFELYGAAAATGPYTLIAGAGTLAPAVGVGTLRTYTESGLVENTTYYRFVSVIGAGGAAWSKAASAYPFSTADRSSPTVTDNQVGDDVWRRTNNGVYDVDLADLGGSGLSKFSVKVSTRAGGLGPDLTGFVDVVVAIGSDTYSADWSLPPSVFDAMPDGSTAYATVRAQDGVGNSTVLIDAFWVRKDTSPPSLVNNQAGDSTLRIASGTLYDVDAFDGGGGLERMQYSASLTRLSADASQIAWTDIPLSAGASSYTQGWSVDFASLTSASTNYISVRAWDRAGSTATLIDAFFVLKDTAGPQVRIQAPASSYRSSLASISGTAADPSGIQGVELKIRQNPPGGLYWNGTGFASAGELWFTAQGTAAWSFAPGSAWVDGTSYQVVARSSDMFGNYAGSYATATFTLDASAPTAGVALPAPDTTISSLAQITGTSSDAGAAVSGVSGVEVRLKRLSDGLWWNFSLQAWSGTAASTIPAGADPWSLTPTERLQAELSHQASYFIAVRAQDNAVPANSGDFFSKGSTFTFSDTTPPAAVSNLSALSGTSPGQMQLSWSAPGDDGSLGMTLLGQYRIHYTTISGVAFDTVSAQVAFSSGQVRPGETQGRLLSGLIAGGTYFVRVFFADDAGNWSGLSNGATAMAAPQPLSRISGHVVKVSSEGITAVLLEAYDEGSALRGTAFTLADGSGTYVLDGLPSRTYKVQASWTAGEITSSVWLDGIAVGSYDINFVLQLNYTLSTLTGTLQSLAVAGVSGAGKIGAGAAGSSAGYGIRAAASNGSAFIARARSDHYASSVVELYQGGRKAVSVPVAPSGRWEITNLLPGKYGVRAFNGVERTQVQEVEVGEGEVKEVSFVFDPLPMDSVFAFPNPARAQTTVRFMSTLLPLEAQVAIFDIAGNLVREIAGAQMNSPAPGLYHAVWDLNNDRGEGVASGVYLFMVKVKGGPDGQSAKVIKKLAVIR